MMLFFSLAVSSIVVPSGGAFLVSRTYRTDPALQALPTPKVTIPVACAATACGIVIMICAPSVGWTAPAAIIMGPIFGLAFLTDAAGRVLPDLLTGTLGIIGICLSMAELGLPVQSAALSLLGIGFGLLAIRRLLMALLGADAFGLGDVKFVAAAASVMPVQQIAVTFIITALIAVGVLLCRAFRRIDDASLPFGSLYVAGFAFMTLIAFYLPDLGR